jgi:signal transduction histidine kinase/ActR/RegA family two-component response regulator
VRLRQGATTVFALTAIIPLLLFLYSGWQLGLIDRNEVRVPLGLGLLVALLGFLILRKMVRRISDLALAMRSGQPPATSGGAADLSVVPGLGSVSELGDFALVLGRILDDLRASTGRLEDLVFKLGMLNETVEIAARIPAIKDLLVHVLERMMRAVRAASGSIMLLDAERQSLTVAVALGRAEDVAGSREIRIGEGVIGKVAAQGEALLVADVASDSRFSEWTHEGGSFICLPLRVGDRIVGVVNLSKQELAAGPNGAVTPFSQTDLQFLNALVVHMAYAVDNARLLEEARHSAQRLQEVVEDQKLRLTLAQQQMVQAAKLSALGQLVAGVAHELNNPLTVLLGYSDLLRENADARQRPMLEGIHEAAESARRIVQGLLTFARRVPLERRLVDLGDLTRKVLDMAASDLRLAQVHIEHEVDRDLPRVWIDPYRLQQVLVNVVTNAKHAMAESSAERRLRVAVLRAGADRTRIVVSDTGPGIPADILPTIFDPFVTTKGPAGTGLGLSISYGIVREHGGQITVESVVGAGTSFTIELPVGAEEADEAAAAPAIGPLLPAKRVVIVEDSALIREMVRSHLEELGCSTVACASAEEALERMDTPFDLALVDFYLPGMTGLEFARRAAERQPELAGRCVFMSGGVLPAPAHETLQATGARLLLKPFSRAQLLEATQEMLAERAESLR